MAITLANGATVLALPDDLIWTDELAWVGVAQATERSITGALIVDAMALTGGRPITLTGDATSAWIERGDLLTLRTWAATPGQEFTLTHNGVARVVIFDVGTGERSRAIETADPVVPYSDPLPGDRYCNLTLRFLMKD